MLNAFRNKRSNILVWVLMVMLVVGLAGFGIGVSGGLGNQDVAQVGDRSVTAEQYGRALDQELRSISSQLGRNLPMSEARQYGIDRMVLGRLVNDATLDAEASRLGLSMGDETVREQVVAAPAFRGPDGKFDRDTYAFVLERTGLSPAEFEEQVRRESARSLVGAGIQSATTMPDTAALTVLDFLGEKRSFDWVRLDPSLLTEPVPAPTEADLEAEHAAHPDRYTRPETRRITYASVTPESLAAGIEIPEDELRAAYETDIAHFSTPERRILDRIGFATEDDAAAAKSRIDAGEADFDSIAAERGLTAAEIDQGTLAAEDLASGARDAVFGLDGPGIVGPVQTPLGPSLYRINAILGASTVPFEEARAEIADKRALEEARNAILDEAAGISDLIAGGAKLEEIAAETDMELGTIDLNAETTGGLADDPAFVELAQAARPGEETDLAELADGGLVTLRVEAIDPAAVIPLEEIRDRVAADWTAARTAEALAALAETYRQELDQGLDFPALAERLGQAVSTGGPLTRGETVEGVPPELVADIFTTDPGETVTRPDGTDVILAQTTAIEAFDPQADGNGTVSEDLKAQFRTQAADDLLALYTDALRRERGVTVNQNLIDATLTRFP